MAVANLILHCGAREVTADELAAVPCPPPEGRWRPVPHATVLSHAKDSLVAAGYEVESMKLGLSRNDMRFFAALVLRAPLVPGVSLAMGVRSSLDKSIALGACFGSRTLVCDNMAFTSSKVIAKKHTTNGISKYREALSRVVSELSEFRTAEAARIRRMIDVDLPDSDAESILLRAYQDAQILSPRTLPTALKEWREPSFVDFSERKNVYRLWQALTFAVGRTKSSLNTQADTTIRISGLLAEATGIRPAEAPLANSA